MHVDCLQVLWWREQNKITMVHNYTSYKYKRRSIFLSRGGRLNISKNPFFVFVISNILISETLN